MKKGTSRISIIIIGVIILSIVLTVVAYNGIYAHKKVFFAQVAKSFSLVDSKVKSLQVNNIFTNKFVVNIMSQIDENLLTPEFKELQRFLNRNKLEGKLDVNKNNLNTSIRLIFNENYTEKLKAHAVSKDLKTYVTLYDKTNNEYIEVEKNDAVKILKSIIFSKNRNENVQKILKEVAKEINSKSIIYEKERIVVDLVNLDTNKYTLELSQENLKKVVTKSIENIKKDKKLMIELNDYIALNIDDNKQAEDVLKDLEETLLKLVSDTLSVKLSISLDEKQNIVAINFENVTRKDIKQDYKVDIYNVKTKNQDILINLYKNGEKFISLVSKRMENGSINATANVKDLIVNMLLSKKENDITFEYTVKEKTETKKEEEENIINNVKINGDMTYRQVVNNGYISYTINSITNGSIYGQKVDLKITVDGMAEKTDKVEELDQNIMIKKYKKMPIDFIINRISEII